MPDMMPANMYRKPSCSTLSLTVFRLVSLIFGPVSLNDRALGGRARGAKPTSFRGDHH